MKTFKLDKFTRGWVCGDFEPSIIRSKHFEVGVREYVKDESSRPHYHSDLEEVTIVLFGEISINGNIFKENDIILLEKKEACYMEILSDKAKLLFIKVPSIPDDKTYVD